MGELPHLKYLSMSSRMIIYIFHRDTPVYGIMKWIEKIVRSEAGSWVYYW